eukprot:8052079-Karenia_brevis.AAC.1
MQATQGPKPEPTEAGDGRQGTPEAPNAMEVDGSIDSPDQLDADERAKWDERFGHSRRAEASLCNHRP